MTDLTKLKELAERMEDSDEIQRLHQRNTALVAALIKCRTALMVGRPSSKLASQKYTEAFAAIDAALEGGGR